MTNEQANLGHTPGPWKINDEHRGVTRIVSGSGDVVAVIGDRGGIHPEYEWAEDEDNSLILAAAPDLLKACKALRYALLGWADNGEQLAHAIGLADAAIAKANGLHDGQ